MCCSVVEYRRGVVPAAGTLRTFPSMREPLVTEGTPFRNRFFRTVPITITPACCGMEWDVVEFCLGVAPAVLCSGVPSRCVMKRGAVCCRREM